MDDALVRLVVILGAVLVALLVGVAIRKKNRSRPEPMDDPGLDPGVYLFTSSACQGCVPARRAVQAALGEEGFIELDWESSPGEFHRLGVGAVPTTIVVSEDGSAMRYPGPPQHALRSLGP